MKRYFANFVNSLRLSDIVMMSAGLRGISPPQAAAPPAIEKPSVSLPRVHGKAHHRGQSGPRRLSGNLSPLCPRNFTDFPQPKAVRVLVTEGGRSARPGGPSHLHDRRAHHNGKVRSVVGLRLPTSFHLFVLWLARVSTDRRPCPERGESPWLCAATSRQLSHPPRQKWPPLQKFAEDQLFSLSGR